MMVRRVVSLKMMRVSSKSINSMVISIIYLVRFVEVWQGVG